MPVIPNNVLAFLKERIDSVEQLEMLLLLKKHPGQEWTAADVSLALATHPAAAASRLAQFHSMGILAVKPGQEPRYQYRPQVPGLDQTIEDVAEAYSKYPVRLITLIYSKPIDNIRTFADAFKFKKGDQ